MNGATPRTAVVTGAGNGIGRAIADRFESDGWDVFRFDVDPVNGGRTVRGDVRSIEDWTSLAQRVGSEVGRLDVLVNNAGVLREALLEDTPLDVWNEVLAINLTGTFLGCQTMLPLLRKGDSACILNMGSIDAVKGSNGHSAYAATKGGIVSMTRALALELAAEGIRVNALCPGTVETGMLSSQLGNPLNTGLDKVAQHPLGRLSAPEEQAAAAAYLCSPEANFVTGVALSVDGGRAIK